MEMRRRASVPLAIAALLTAVPALPCKRVGPVDPKETVRSAEVIVVASPRGYVREPTGEPDGPGAGLVDFEVIEIIEGSSVPRRITLSGFLTAKDDFNDREVPYDLVRPGGRGGSCFATTYGKNGLFLLLLQVRDGDYRVESDPLAPVNEQLHGKDDPWAEWVRAQVRGSGRAAS